MATYECDCEFLKKRRCYGRFTSTKVDKEGKCVKCGSYAIAVSQYNLHPRRPSQGGYRPIAKARTLQSKGYTWEQIYDLKGMDRWILISNNKLRQEHHTKKEKECKFMEMNI